MLKAQQKKMYLIDHYDSFSWNVLDWLRGGDGEWEVEKIDYDDEPGMVRVLVDPLPTVLSPGPRNPNDAQPTIALASALLGKVPLLGICLGHQILGILAGCSITRAQTPFHGSAFPVVIHRRNALLQDIPDVFYAATYNSLVVVPENLAPDWSSDAVNEAGEVQALSYNAEGRFPAFGVQFHPESFLSEYKDRIRINWLGLASY